MSRFDRVKGNINLTVMVGSGSVEHAAKISKVMIMFFIAVLLLPMTSLARNEAVWSADMIKQKLTNQTIQGNGWSMYMDKNGDLKGREGSSGDRGEWAVNDDGKFCRTWQSWGQGRESCFTVLAKDETRLIFKNVSGPTATFKGRLLSGNPKGL